MAPTTSTTLQLIIGDAIAIALLECKNFQEKDFAKFHPGGSLGKLYLRVGDLIKVNKCPKIETHQNIMAKTLCFRIHVENPYYFKRSGKKGAEEQRIIEKMK